MGPLALPTATHAAGLLTARWEALGTSVVLRVTERHALQRASTIVAADLDAIDFACSRFRADSELSRVNAGAGGAPLQVTPLLIAALQVALRAAECSDGDVDPTVGTALVLAGYDRDWQLLERATDPVLDRELLCTGLARGWRCVSVRAAAGARSNSTPNAGLCGSRAGSRSTWGRLPKRGQRTALRG